MVETKTQKLVYRGTYKKSDVQGEPFDASFTRCIAAVGKDPYVLDAPRKAVEYQSAMPARPTDREADRSS